MPDPEETFWQFIWRITKQPLKAFGGSPLHQSAAAAGLNLWCLILAVLGQFWVFFSATLLLGQACNTWLVATGRMRPATALSIGLLIVLINLGALALAVLGQFWVAASTVLACWQFVSLVRVCAQHRSRAA